MRRWCGSVLVLALAGAARGEEPAEAWAKLASVQHLQARFTEVQHRKLLKAPLTSTGTLAFSRPGQLRWEVEGAGASTFVLDGEQISVKMPGIPATQHLDLASQPQLAGLVAGLTVWLAGDIAAVEERYALAWTLPRTATLTPKDPGVGKMVSSITLELAADASYIERVRMVEPDGDTMEITLSAVDTTTPIPASRYRLE